MLLTDMFTTSSRAATTLICMLYAKSKLSESCLMMTRRPLVLSIRATPNSVSALLKQESAPDMSRPIADINTSTESRIHEGVGHDYQDHHLTLYAYRTNLSKRDTINAFSDGRIDVAQAIKDTDELLGTNAMDACESQCISCCRAMTEKYSQLESSDQLKKMWTLLVQNSVQHGIATSKMLQTGLS